jgi:hypothetical protein
MSKYRIVEFENRKFALQRKLFGIFPCNSFKDLTDSEYHWGIDYKYFNCCLSNSEEEIKLKMKEFNIKRVVNDD